MSLDPSKMVRDQEENYRKAIKYLDECGEFTYEKFVKTNQIAGASVRDNEIRMMWEMEKKTIATKVDGKYLIGTERLRLIIREKLEKAIAEFGPIANKFDSLQSNGKKWWQFWK